MKKKLLLGLLAVIMCFTLVGCGNNESTSGGNSGTSGGSEQNGSDLKNVSTSNYKSVVKDLYGIEIADISGWKIEKAESPNKVTNLNLDFEIRNSSDGKQILEQYYNKAVAVSKDGVYSYGFNDSYQVEKETKYNSFEELYKKATIYDGFYQMSYIYDYNGKDIQFSITIRENLEAAELSFVFC